ncbi:pre-16S rRNA-processing nuclease YqgF [filamentous cyanobacterium LEGE 07170]|nr:pre-16S rRNA-processing nuclease YqgF [filamentous cyanobacterium LEGE 07170]
MVILGFDPGRDKCGVAIRDGDGNVAWHEVIRSEEAMTRLPQICQDHGVSLVVMGNQTTARQWHERLATVLPEMLPIVLVDERNSTLEARDRYWQLYPAKGLQALVPQSLRAISRPIDDIVAILLIERYLRTVESSGGG